ncbi:uncharacterized protein [Dysidea avara]|uniref:uncharacterized protein n=1 Tax=Dysidea avara TaxID=196820 RepID=UPI00332DB1BF
MLCKITFAILCLVVYYQPTATTPVDDNDMAELVMKNYFSVVKASGRMVGCRPKIVVGRKGSRIQPFSGWRGNVALIVDYGDCAPGRKGYICAVNWGDGTPPQIKRLDDFGPCQLAHQYPKVNAEYSVTAFYCSSPPTANTVSSCSTYCRTIDTSYDPGNSTLIF